MAANRRRSATPSPDLSPEDLLALRRQAPDYEPPPPPPVSWDDFLAWLDEDTHAEWVDGEIIEMSPASDEHQLILGFLYRLLMEIVEARQLGSVYFAPYLMRLPLRPSGREPDLLFVRAEHAERATRTSLSGPADLAVEIVSTDSVERDHREKLAEYEAAGIPEYWVIDPRLQDARFYQLDENGRYRLGTIGEQGIFSSHVVTGFRLRVSWLWRRPLPTLASAVADLPD
jgi:Uma2 family endonuclease